MNNSRLTQFLLTILQMVVFLYIYFFTLTFFHYNGLLPQVASIRLKTLYRNSERFLCEELAPESLKENDACWGPCNNGTSEMITCDQSVASWRAEATFSHDFSTYPGDQGCNSDTLRFLCIMKQRSTQLCSNLKPKSMKDGDSCWTECGEMECLSKYNYGELFIIEKFILGKYLINADYDFAKENSSFDFKLADCSSYSTGRRYCRVIKLIPSE